MKLAKRMEGPFFSISGGLLADGLSQFEMIHLFCCCFFVREGLNGSVQNIQAELNIASMLHFQEMQSAGCSCRKVKEQSSLI